MTDIGKHFAYRQRAFTPGEPVCPVEVVKEGPSRSNKVRIRWLDGEYEGLEEWVPKVRLVASWEQAKALLEDEERMLAALDASGEVYETVPWRAVQMVFWSLPQGLSEEIHLGHRAIERELLVIRDLDTTTGIGLDTEALLAEPNAFIDRFGEYKAPFQAAVQVAKQCCERFAQDVLRYVKVEEDALQDAVVSGYYAWPGLKGEVSHVRREWAEERLSEQESVFDLVKEWCGQATVEKFDQAHALREEVDRLRNLIEDTARWLRDAGHPVKAALLRKELDQSSHSERQ